MMDLHSLGLRKASCVSSLPGLPDPNKQLGHFQAFQCLLRNKHQPRGAFLGPNPAPAWQNLGSHSHSCQPKVTISWLPPRYGTQGLRWMLEAGGCGPPAPWPGRCGAEQEGALPQQPFGGARGSFSWFGWAGKACFFLQLAQINPH